MATAGKLHREAILKHCQDGGPVYKLYSAICAYHQQRDASHCHEAWMQFLALCKSPSESYTSLCRRVKASYFKIDCITPAGQSTEERGKELILFTLLSTLPHDDPLRTSLIVQKDLTLADTAVALLCFDTGRKLAKSSLEQAHGALGSSCWACGDKEHIQRNCPHQEVFQQFITKRKGAGNGSSGRYRRGKGRNDAKAKANATDAAATNANTNATNANTTNTDRTHETAGVATLFLSNESRVTDIWLCDSGASSSMSGDRSVFRRLTADWRLVRLADGKVIYFKGLGTIDFLSDLSYVVSIHDALFVPSLSVNLFSMNKFAKEHCDTHSETTEYPKRRWINRHTGAVEFTATIQANDLAYLDWKVAPQAESLNVSMEELHARLNHLPFPALRHLVQTGSVNGVPKRVTGTPPDGDFCEDCVNGKLTRAPHTHPVTHAEAPLQRVYTDVHGLVPTHSRHGHVYWVSFVDNYSRFPTVYYIRRKSDVFTAFKQYRAWVENVTRW